MYASAMNRLLAAAALALAFLACGDDDEKDPPWGGVVWYSAGYPAQGDILEVVRRGNWGGAPVPCDLGDGEYLVELLKLTGGEPRNVWLVGGSPCPFGGRVRVEGDFTCTSTQGGTAGGVMLVRDD